MGGEIREVRSGSWVRFRLFPRPRRPPAGGSGAFCKSAAAVCSPRIGEQSWQSIRSGSAAERLEVRRLAVSRRRRAGELAPPALRQRPQPCWWGSTPGNLAQPGLSLPPAIFVARYSASSVELPVLWNMDNTRQFWTLGTISAASGTDTTAFSGCIWRNGLRYPAGTVPRQGQEQHQLLRKHVQSRPKAGGCICR